MKFGIRPENYGAVAAAKAVAEKKNSIQKALHSIDRQLVVQTIFVTVRRACDGNPFSDRVQTTIDLVAATPQNSIASNKLAGQRRGIEANTSFRLTLAQAYIRGQNKTER